MLNSNELFICRFLFLIWVIYLGIVEITVYNGATYKHILPSLIILIIAISLVICSKLEKPTEDNPSEKPL
jgi:hypothetical protein